MKRFSFRASAAVALMLLSAPALAVPGEQQTVTDVYGHHVMVRDSDDQLPKYALIGKAYQVALYKGDAGDAMYGEINRPDFDRYLPDKDMGPFIEVAKADKRSAVVLILPANSGSRTHAVYFSGSVPVAYGVGRNAKAADIKHTLVTLPGTIPPAPGMEEGSAMRLRPYNVFADNGDALTVFKIMHTGKPEVPWTFGDGTSAPQQ